MGEGKMGEREPKRLTRRNFLKIIGGLAGLAALGGCGPTPEKPVVEPTEPAKPTEKPVEQTKVPEASPTPKPIEASPTKVSTKEPTPTKIPPTEVIKRISRVKVIGEDLTKGLVVGQGGEITLPTPTPEKGQPETKTSVGDFLGFVSRNWQELKKIEAGDLMKNRVSALKFLLSIGQLVGFDKTTFNVKETFPEIDLSLFRATMSKLPSGEKSEVVADASPSGLKIYEGTHLTVIGTSEQSKKVLVTFDRWSGKSGEDPRQHWALISPEYLASLLAKNGIPFNVTEGEISFKDEKGTKCILEIPVIEENFFQDLVKDGGCLWMDESKNPVVPFPPEGKAERTKEGRAVAKDSSGKEIYEAKYNEKTNGWEWEKIVEIEAPTIEGLKKLKEGDKIVYRAEAKNTYGLKEGVFAGYFYPETYILDLATNFEKEQKIGAVGLRAEVVKVLLQKAGYPNKIVFGIPFDVSYGNKEEKIIICETKGRKTGNTYLFFHLPKESRLVASLPEAQNKCVLDIAPQTWNRTMILIGGNDAFVGGYTFDLMLPNTGLKAGKVILNFGDSLLDFSLGEKFNNEYINFLGDSFNIPEILKLSRQELNVIINSQTLFEPLKYAEVTKQNLVKMGDSPVFILANDNPLLGK